MLDIKDELHNLQLENKSLQIQLEHISASDENTFKVSDRRLETTNVRTHTNSEPEKDFMRRTCLQGEEDIKLNINQDIEKQIQCIRTFIQSIQVQQRITIYLKR